MDSIFTPEVPPDPPPENKAYLIFAYLGIALGIFLAWFRAWVWSYGIVNAEMLGYALGGVFVPALIAYLIVGRKSVRNFNRFAMWFSWISILFVLLGSRPVSLSQHIGNLMKEAAGTAPVDNASRPQNLDDVIRVVMRDMLDQRKAFDKETSQYREELARLYSVESFSSQDAMKRCSEAVRGVVAADQRYSQQIEDLPNRIEARVQNSGLSIPISAISWTVFGDHSEA